MLINAYQNFLSSKQMECIAIIYILISNLWLVKLPTFKSINTNNKRGIKNV